MATEPQSLVARYLRMETLPPMAGGAIDSPPGMGTPAPSESGYPGASPTPAAPADSGAGAAPSFPGQPGFPGSSPASPPASAPEAAPAPLPGSTLPGAPSQGSPLPSAPAYQPAPAAAPDPVYQAQAYLQQQAAGLQSQLQQLQAAEQAVALQEQTLAEFRRTANPDQLDMLTQREQQVAAAKGEIVKQALAWKQSVDQLGAYEQNLQTYAQQSQVAQERAMLEQYAQPIVIDQLVRQAQQRTPALGQGQYDAAMRQYVASYAPYGAEAVQKAVGDYENWVRYQTVQQRAANGTDNVGGSTSAPTRSTDGSPMRAQAIFANMLRNQYNR
jgi:hypothetical protein